MSFHVLVMLLDLDLGDDDKAMKALVKTLQNVEEGLGADGVGHGRLRPPAEELAIGDSRLDLLGGGDIQEGDKLVG